MKRASCTCRRDGRRRARLQPRRKTGEDRRGRQPRTGGARAGRWRVGSPGGTGRRHAPTSTKPGRLRPTLVRCLPSSAHLWPGFDSILSSSAELRPTSPNAGPHWTNLGQDSTNLARHRPNLARIRPNPALMWPNLAQIRPQLIEFKGIWPDGDSMLPGFGRLWPLSTDSWPMSTRVGRFRPMLARSAPNLAGLSRHRTGDVGASRSVLDSKRCTEHAH